MIGPYRISEDIEWDRNLTYFEFLEIIQNKKEILKFPFEGTNPVWPIFIKERYDSETNTIKKKSYIIVHNTLKKPLVRKDEFTIAEEIILFFCPEIRLSDFRKIQDLLYESIIYEEENRAGWCCSLEALYSFLIRLNYRIKNPESKKEEE